VAHGRFRTVHAVWDAPVAVRPPSAVESRSARASGSATPRGVSVGGSQEILPALLDIWGRIVRKAPRLEETLFLIFFLAMVGFVIDWTLRMLGVR